MLINFLKTNPIKSRTLLLAAIYNGIWGAWVIFFPLQSFGIGGSTPPLYPELWQCIGMIVGIYGIGYLIAAFDPARHWPIIFVGLLGKILGPIGFANALWEKRFPLEFGIHIIFNDLIWWIPLTLLLRKIYLTNRENKITA